jgi:hypothetical protein
MSAGRKPTKWRISSVIIVMLSDMASQFGAGFLIGKTSAFDILERHFCRNGIDNSLD